MSFPLVIIAKNTFVEMIRDRVLYIVLIFSILFMAFCFALGQLSYNEIFRLSVSMGQSGIHLCFSGLTIFLGCSVFYKEIEMKTIYTLLARPVTRDQYLLGKFLGLMSILLVILVGFIACFTIIELFLGMPLLITSYYSFLGMFLESMVLLSITFLFSCFAKPFLSITGSLSFFLIGHWVSNLEKLADKKGVTEHFKMISQFISRTFPDLELVNWRDFAVAKSHVGVNELVMSSFLVLLWAMLFFLLSLLIFRKKDFE